MEEEKQKSLEPIKVGEWVWTVLVTYIPIVGIIMLFVWAFSESTNVNKKNWAKANLILVAIGFAAWLFFATMFVGVLSNF